MAFVDNGIIVRSDSTWLYVLPRCPHCGHMRQVIGQPGPGEYVNVGTPKNEWSTHSIGTTCPKCMKTFRITAYHG
jgi:hypothetical protein